MASMLGDYYSKKMSGYRDTGMQSYMERRLTDLHYASVDSVKTVKEKLLAFFAGTFLVVILPFLHIGVFYMLIWVPDKPEIDRKRCTCNCFDTVFRGRYENPGKTPYKHIYFNSTKSSLKIWIMTVLFVLMGYESVKYLTALLRRRMVRYSMFLLYLINLYPQYYSWWSYFSYYNEEFFTYYYHHMFFTVTEIVATCMVLNLCDVRNEINSWKILLIVTINVVHVLVAGTDQFFSHVLLGLGRNFQSARDVGLMVPDLLFIIIPLYTLHRHARKKELTFFQVCSKEEICIFLVFVTFGFFMGRVI